MSNLPRLSRLLLGLPAAAPVRLVHLGLGNFHRAHQAWYTANASDASEWGIAAFTGRRPDAAEALAPQDGLYTLITPSAKGDTFDVMGADFGGSPRERSPGVPRLPATARGGSADDHRV
jgi:fructuronate reductase